MRAGEPFGAPEGVRLKRYSRSEIDIPNGRLATLCVMAHRHGADGTLNRHGAQSDGREEEKLCKYRKDEWNLPPRYMQIFVQNWHFERARRESFTFLAFPPLHWSLFTLFTSSNTSITLKHLTEHAEAV